MKLILVIGNIFLTCLVAWSLYNLFNGSEEVVYSAGRSNTAAATGRSVEKTETVSASAEMSVEEAKNSLLHNDVFALSRCPALENNAQNMTLAGIIITAQTQGAVIIQSANNRNGQQGRQGNRNNNNNAAASTSRYFQVGEKINDQYTLSAVTRNSVTLSGPTGTRVLEIQKASAGQNTGGNRNNNQRWGMWGQMQPWMMWQSGWQNMQQRNGRGRQQGWQQGRMQGGQNRMPQNNNRRNMQGGRAQR